MLATAIRPSQAKMPSLTQGRASRDAEATFNLSCFLSSLGYLHAIPTFLSRGPISTRRFTNFDPRVGNEGIVV